MLVIAWSIITWLVIQFEAVLTYLMKYAINPWERLIGNSKKYNDKKKKKTFDWTKQHRWN